MKQLKFALIALLPLLLTGCWDGRDPEDRAYVITMGIDKGEDGLLVTFAPAKTTEGNSQSVYRVKGDTLTAAVAEADSRSSREVYLGQLRTVVFGKSLLADKAAFEAVLEELERGNALSEKVMVLGTENAADACVNAIAEADSSTGLFLWDFYKNTAQEVAVTRGMDLDMLLTELGEQSGSTVLPRIEKTEEGLSLGGGIALADGAYAFSLPAAEEQAHLLLLGEGSGAVIEGNWNGTVLPLEIRKDKVSFDFAKTGEGLSCQVNVKVSGALTGSGGQSLLDGNTRRELENFFGDIIKTDLENTIKRAQETTAGDVFGLWGKCQRQAPEVAKSGENWQDLQVLVNCEVKLQDTGRTR